LALLTANPLTNLSRSSIQGSPSQNRKGQIHSLNVDAQSDRVVLCKIEFSPLEQCRTRILFTCEKGLNTHLTGIIWGKIRVKAAMSVRQSCIKCRLKEDDKVIFKYQMQYKARRLTLLIHFILVALRGSRNPWLQAISDGIVIVFGDDDPVGVDSLNQLFESPELS
jgi:hypothetical protein